jgi:hypothetical protein
MVGMTDTCLETHRFFEACLETHHLFFSLDYLNVHILFVTASPLLGIIPINT